MNTISSVGAGIPSALHVDTNAFPYAKDFGAPGVNLMLLQADTEAGVFAVRIRFAPGVQLPPHKHTGVVHAFTLAGRWNYLEDIGISPDNTAGSYLFEPTGSVHTLKIADDNTGFTDVFFVIYGAMLVLDEQGTVVAVLDAASHHNDWQASLRDQCEPVPRFIEGGRAGYAGA